MRLSEIAEFIVEKYPNCCMAINNVVDKGNREDWYEEYLIDNLMDFFSYEVMDICPSGSPQYTNDMIRKILNIRKDSFEKHMYIDEIHNRYEKELHLNALDLFHYGALQFILYILDSKGIVEYGSSVNMGWLTELGEMYLVVLNAWHEQEEDYGRA